MKKLISLIASFLVGCASVYKPDVWDDMNDKKIHTLRLYTGSKGEDLYKSNFEEKAKAVCKNGYEVVEKTRTPKTLHPKLNEEAGYFNWVIKCL